MTLSLEESAGILTVTIVNKDRLITSSKMPLSLGESTGILTVIIVNKDRLITSKLPSSPHNIHFQITVCEGTWSEIPGTIQENKMCKYIVFVEQRQCNHGRSKYFMDFPLLCGANIYVSSCQTRSDAMHPLTIHFDHLCDLLSAFHNHFDILSRDGHCYCPCFFNSEKKRANQ